jgi:hypothetical protein
MKMFKEVAISRLTHNGKEYQKGETVRERVPLSPTDERVLRETPELTNCEYIEIKDTKEPEKVTEVKSDVPKVGSENEVVPDLTTNTNFKNLAELTRIANSLGLTFPEGTAKKVITVAIVNKRDQIKAQNNAQ